MARFDHHPFSLRQLQYVVAVAEAGGFRRAADLCGVSQPSLSAQVSALEGALGVRLFERDRRTVLLTHAGTELLARARVLLVEADDFALAARGLNDPLGGLLRLGVIPTVGPYLLPDLDPALRAAFPRLEIRWTEDKTHSLVDAVTSGRLDAALVAAEADLRGLTFDAIGRDDFLFASSPTHPLAAFDVIDPTALVDTSVLLLDDGHCFGGQALGLCASVGAHELGFRATSLATLVQMVVAGQGVTLLPRVAAGVENRRGGLALREFSGPRPGRTLGFVWRGRSPLAEPMLRLSAAARTHGVNTIDG